jgi:hypothetical protein
MDLCYAEVITEPNLLRQYKNFSPQTYGESRPLLVSKLIGALIRVSIVSL